MFGYEYDVVLRQAMKRRSDVQSTLSMPGLIEAVAAIKEQVEAESAAVGANTEKTSKTEDDEAIEGEDTPPELTDLPDMKRLMQRIEPDDDKTRKVSYYQSYAKKLVETHMEFIVESEPDDVIAQRLKDSVAMKTKGDPTKKTHA